MRLELWIYIPRAPRRKEATKLVILTRNKNLVQLFYANEIIIEREEKKQKKNLSWNAKHQHLEVRNREKKNLVLEVLRARCEYENGIKQ